MTTSTISWTATDEAPALAGRALLPILKAFTAGTGIEFYRSLMRMAAEPERAAPLFSGVVLESTATLSVALLVALAAGVAWFVLAGRIARLEEDVASAFQEVK